LAMKNPHGKSNGSRNKSSLSARASCMHLGRDTSWGLHVTFAVRDKEEELLVVLDSLDRQRGRHQGKLRRAMRAGADVILRLYSNEVD